LCSTHILKLVCNELEQAEVLPEDAAAAGVGGPGDVRQQTHEDHQVRLQPAPLEPGEGRWVALIFRLSIQNWRLKEDLSFLTVGLYHGKDVMFGHSISHSHTRSKKKWFPNVQNKRVFSEALDDWVRFKITTRALKEIDNVGGIDNYILSLDEKSVSESNYVTKIRGLIAGKLFHQGLLSDRIIRRLGYDKQPPSVVEKSAKPAAQS
jgi:ribosomal protein L28